MFLSDPGGLPLKISIIVVIIHGHKGWEVGQDLDLEIPGQRCLLRESGDLEQHSTRHQKCPSAKLDRREQKNYRRKIFWSAKGVLKSCTWVLEETTRASLFSNLLKA